jgi:hypothetical protein
VRIGAHLARLEEQDVEGKRHARERAAPHELEVYRPGRTEDAVGSASASGGRRANSLSLCTIDVTVRGLTAARVRRYYERVA